MNRTIVFHIGPAKTGTTTLQKYLSINDSQLLKAGVLYPAAGRYTLGEEYRISFRNRLMDVKGPMPCHHKLSWVLQGKHTDLQGELLLRSILKEIEDSSAHTVLFSSETFPSLSADLVRQLGACFSGYRVKVLFYHRDVRKWLMSVYNQDVKIGRTFDAFNNYVLAEQILPFAEMLAPWVETFGKENLIIRDFDAAVKGGNLINDLKQVLGIQLETELIETEVANESLDMNVTNGLLYFNKLELSGRLSFIPASLRYAFRNRVLQSGTWPQRIMRLAGWLLPVKNTKSIDETVVSFKSGWYDLYESQYLAMKKSYGS